MLARNVRRGAIVKDDFDEWQTVTSVSPPSVFGSRIATFANGREEEWGPDVDIEVDVHRRVAPQIPYDET